MSKFKVGDRVMATRGEAKHQIGTVILFQGGDDCGDDWPLVEFDSWFRGHDGDGRGKPKQCWYCEAGHLEAVRTKILITTDGTNTLARLYEGDKVVKSAKAKCDPSDTYDFAVGANLAYDRLMERIGMTDPKREPVEDKPELEPVKLYCYKSHEDKLVVGKTYSTDPNGCFIYEDGTKTHSRFYNPHDVVRGWLSNHLVPLVSRPAKVGEWVLIVSAFDAFDDYKNGDILRADRMYRDDIQEYGVEGGVFICANEYLVLEGYAPEPEKPKYYSGKVVCVDDCGCPGFWTVGKVYTFIDGATVANTGWKTSQYETLAHANGEMGGARIGAKFIEFKG